MSRHEMYRDLLRIGKLMTAIGVIAAIFVVALFFVLRDLIGLAYEW